MNVGDTLGGGTFGVVFVALDGNTKVALKKIKMEREKQGFPVTAIREIRILKALQHENIVELREIVVFNEENDRAKFKTATEFSHGDVFMVFEYVDYDLYGLLKSPGVILSQAHVRSFIKQLLEGVNFLHKNHIIHRDIKSANILIDSKNQLKLADWGLARFNPKNGNRMSNNVVTLWYRSPELLCGVRKYGSEIDMWSVGCIFAEMKTRQPILAVNGDSDLKQMELLWNECGTNLTPDTLKKYEEYPNWDKFKFTQPSEKSLRQRFETKANTAVTTSRGGVVTGSVGGAAGKKWDNLSLTLLEGMLDWNPESRISAIDALSHDFFAAEQGVIPWERLPKFENVNFARQSDVVKKQKEDHEKAVEASRRAEIRKKEAAAAQAEKSAAKQQNVVSRKRKALCSAGGGGQGGIIQSKYKIVKREKPAPPAQSADPFAVLPSDKIAAEAKPKPGPEPGAPPVDSKIQSLTVKPLIQ